MPPSPDSSHELIFSVNPQYTSFDSPDGFFHGQSIKELVNLYDSIPPLLRLGSQFTLGDWLTARLVIDHGPSPRFMNGQGSFTPWYWGTLVDLDFPREGYISLAIPQANLAAGRFRNGIGHGFFGNTSLNGQANYNDQVQFGYYNHSFKFYYMLG